jgi:tetratricopeptide (TPR) repeat protein
MKWILFCLLVSACFVHAQEQDYIQIYQTIGQADALKQNGQTQAAIEHFQQAQTALQKLQSEYPNWNETIVKFRLDYIAENLKTLTETPTNAAIAPTIVFSENSPVSKLHAEIVALQKQRDLLKVSLEEESKALEQKIIRDSVTSALVTEPQKVETNSVPAEVSPEPTPVPAIAKENSGPAPETKDELKKQIPSGAGALVAQAEKAFAAGRFDEAEKLYLEVLRQDENNVYILGNLAATEMEMDHIDDVEKHVNRALEINPNDAFSLTMLGMVKFRQQKFDDALDLLSRSAKIDPKNPETQNYLGITLSQKNRGAEAETALRKAVALQPGYAGAHFNLALVYASEKPPFLELARWHYDKSVALGHPRNPEVEKMLEPGK